MKTCIISCFFGKKIDYVYPAVKKYDACFFTNNPNLKSIVEAKGWTYIFIDFPLLDDYVESTLQSKYVKFLQFLNDDKFSFFDKYNHIIHTDHKLKLTEKHIKQIIDVQNKPILQRNHPDKKRQSIWDEFADSMQQERYRRNSDIIIDYLREKIRDGYEQDFKSYKLATNGLLSYQNPNNSKTREFLAKIYSDGEQTKICQDQIIWFMVAQKYSDIIQVIDWYDLDIKWAVPEKKGAFFYLKMAIKAVVPYGLLKLWRIVTKK
jgi:hypothetical protein